MTDEEKELAEQYLPKCEITQDKLIFNAYNIPWTDITNCEVETKSASLRMHIYGIFIALIWWVWGGVCTPDSPGRVIAILIGCLSYCGVIYTKSLKLQLFCKGTLIASHKISLPWGSKRAKVEQLYRELKTAIDKKSLYGSK